MKNKLSSLAVTLATAISLIACSGLSSEQRSSADEALKALRKIAAATQVGVNYQQYGSLVIDAQAQVNEASAKLPDGELKKEMNAAMEAYADASQAWSAKISGERMLWSNLGVGKTLIPKHNLTLTFGQGVDVESALQQLWAIGRKHLDAASKDLEEKIMAIAAFQ